ncbi:hypothetical protein P9209_10200 [Prescottella defluvii]|nr:hypothetical protein P9209_10200 [Prescottella defluvii]
MAFWAECPSHDVNHKPACPIAFHFGGVVMSIAADSRRRNGEDSQVGTMKTTLKIAATAAGACAALALGSGTASAFTVQPIAGGTKIEINHSEAVALSQVRVVGPLLNPLYPRLVNESGNGLRAGDTVQVSIDRAARTNGGVGMDIYGPLHNPDSVRGYLYK